MHRPQCGNNISEEELHLTEDSAEVIPQDIANVLKRALVWCGYQITTQQREDAFAWLDERSRYEEMGS